MSAPKKNRLLDELRLKINQQLPAKAPVAPETKAAPAAAQEPQPAAEPKAATAAARVPASRPKPEAAPRTGRGMQLYLDDTDRKIIHSLAVWFGSQDRRVSDSQVVKAAIRFSAGQQSSRLLQIADDVRATDRRHRKATAKKPPRRA